MSRKSILSSRSLSWIAGAVLLPAAAWADGAVVRPSDLGADRSHIAARIAEARARDPEMFKLVAAIDTYKPEGARRMRSQSPTAVAIIYRRLGERARWALADLAAFHAPDRAGLDDKSWQALQVGLIDSIGVARDPDLAPLLRAAFLQSDAAPVAGAAAVGLGHLGASELPLLLAHARAGDARYLPAVRGLGESHGPEAATALAALLDGASDDAEATTIANALAESGSSWVWGTGKAGSEQDGQTVRRTCAEALVRNYARLSGQPAAQVEIAIRRVAHPDTQSLIAAARAHATGDAAARLDRLQTIELPVRGR